MTAVRRFLARLEKQTAVRALIFAGLLALIAATMFALNAHTPLQMDDYDYSISWATGKPVSGLADVIASQAAHYRLWGGRSVVHALAQMFLYMGKGVFNIANTVMYLLLLLEIYALAKPKGKRFCWTLLFGGACFFVFRRVFFRNGVPLAGRRMQLSVGHGAGTPAAVPCAAGVRKDGCAECDFHSRMLSGGLDE